MKNNKSVLKWIYEQIKSHFAYILLTSLLNAAIAVSYLLMANASRNVIDTAAGASKNTFILSAVLIMIFIIAQIIFDFAVSMINTYLAGKITISMRNHLFSSVVKKKYPDVFEHHSGDLLNRFTSDVEQVVSGSVSIIPSLSSMITKIVAGIMALIVENYIFAIAVFLVGFLFPLVGRIISRKYKYLHKEVQRIDGQAKSFLQESFANIVVIKTFVSELPILKKLNMFMDENLKMRMKRSSLSVSMHLCLYSVFTIGYYGVLVWGASQIAVGAMTTGTLIYFLQLVSMLRAPLQNISGVIPRYHSMVASAERLIELEDMEDEPEILSVENTNKTISGFKTIKAEHLAFGYEDEIVIKDSTFTIYKNSITAITGESGSGKSTLFKLLLGLYEPIGGTLTFNGNIKIDASTRPLFSYVPQNNMIISGTVRENLTLGNSEVSEEELIAVCKAAMIYEYIASLPKGFDTMISEQGAGFSQGQIQRISIARALLYGAPILLLDESTSALDEETETQLLANIKTLTDKTVIFITHRNTSISICDHILHIENKKFTEIQAD